MLSRKNNIVIGLTTFHNELLRISVPALSRLPRKFLLIIFNDNPLTAVTRRQIRQLGYRGDLQIINSDENIGPMRARMAIVAAASKIKPAPDWIVFNDDDDMIVNLDDAPNVSDDTFAVLQNSLILRNRISNLMLAMNNPEDCQPDGTDIVLDTPHIGFTGTLIRLSVLIGMADVIDKVLPHLVAIDDGLSFRPPLNTIMWNFVCAYARDINPNAAPIYMNRTSQIITDLDCAKTKYGRARWAVRGGGDAVRRVVAKYDAAFAVALAAALRG